jgi:oxygen-independent coproporphyrinogen-3 oxidase
MYRADDLNWEHGVGNTAFIGGMEPEGHFLIRCEQESVSLSPALLTCHDVPGPRYTSYPTAPEWSDAFGPADLRLALEESNAQRPLRPLSLYMHLPFCRSLCLFCGCNVVISKKSEVAVPYLESLKHEIDEVTRVLAPGRAVTQFHWGGGTPTYLSPGQLEDLFGFAAERFRFAPGAEIGVELDPRVTAPDHLRTLRRLGFNRLSMGVQDFDERVQQTIRRIQPYEQTSELLDLGRAQGFESINVDLIYGLPHQTPESFSRTLDRVIEMGPDRIAMYSYAHVPWLKKQQGSFARFISSGLEKFRLFSIGLERFTAAGFRFIGFDHFARPDDELCVAQRERTLTRNFQGYTTHGGADLLAFGVSAISSVGQVYAQSFRDLPAYYERIAAGELPTMRGWRLSDDDVLRREVILRLLCHCRLRKHEIEEEFAIDFDAYFADELERLAELERDGLVRLSSDEIHVTLLGKVFLRVIGMVFDVYLRRRDAGGRPLFSRTV